MALPPGLDEAFALPPVSNSRFGFETVDGVPTGPSDVLLPCLAVLPMGWNWAVHWCQAVLEQGLRDAGVKPNQVKADGGRRSF